MDSIGFLVLWLINHFVNMDMCLVGGVPTISEILYLIPHRVIAVTTIKDSAPLHGPAVLRPHYLHNTND